MFGLFRVMLRSACLSLWKDLGSQPHSIFEGIEYENLHMHLLQKNVQNSVSTEESTLVFFLERLGYLF